jgi:hypothetical protein
MIRFAKPSGWLNNTTPESADLHVLFYEEDGLKYWRKATNEDFIDFAIHVPESVLSNTCIPVKDL